PTRQKKVVVTGSIRAPRSPRFDWLLQAGIGPNPQEKQWFEIGAGSGRGRFSGRLGVLKLSKIPKAVWAKPFAMSKTQEQETTEEYTVSFRLRVLPTANGGAVNDAGRIAEDRRA